ncbi:hypothetical protein HMPREF0083_02439 [Aneurinibacillus aneurinilyticus ATCC 12856]|uniref:Uncharacterized protein n=1 Tax=Aneurinibacillus aneurinilyticus ATCC 12856 TaxID=649747 RepID=U1WLL9_ANEAE|nr:hypothetical protein HMPREF0083_02439 [Aneurinibacillus aneurinilyticus ATCC 12856]
MDVLPKTLREQLINEFGENILNINPVSEHTSQQVKKVLFRLPDSNKIEAVGIHVTVRQQFGIDINAACGQLYGQYQKRHITIIKSGKSLKGFQ